MSKSRLFGGIPTDMEVKKLRENLPLTRGDIVEHSRIAAVIGHAPGTSRYKSIVVAWVRRVLRETNLQLKSLRGVGYRVLDEHERIGDAVDTYTRGTRQMVRGARKVAVIERPRLTEIDQGKLEHVERHITRVVAEARLASKEMSIRLQPQDQNPRLRPGS